MNCYRHQDKHKEFSNKFCPPQEKSVLRIGGRDDRDLSWILPEYTEVLITKEYLLFYSIIALLYTKWLYNPLYFF